MPVHAYAPSSMPGENIFGQSFIPVTDTNCWIYTYAWNPERPLTQSERDGYANGNGVMSVVDGNYVPLRNKANDYLIDRKLQKTKSYTASRASRNRMQRCRTARGRSPIAPASISSDRSRHYAFPETDDGMRPRAAAGRSAAHLAHQDRYTVRSGGCVTHKSKDLPEVMMERFGDVTGFVGRPGRDAAAE